MRKQEIVPSPRRGRRWRRKKAQRRAPFCSHRPQTTEMHDCLTCRAKSIVVRANSRRRLQSADVDELGPVGVDQHWERDGLLVSEFWFFWFFGFGDYSRQRRRRRPSFRHRQQAAQTLKLSRTPAVIPPAPCSPDRRASSKPLLRHLEEDRSGPSWARGFSEEEREALFSASSRWVFGSEEREKSEESFFPSLSLSLFPRMTPVAFIKARQFT